MRRGVLVAVGLVLTLLLGACGGAASPATSSGTGKGSAGADFATLKAANRTQQLEAAAKSEGEVDWYTDLAGPAVQAVAKAFEQQYPYIKVSTYRADSTSLLTQLSQAAAAGRHTADTLEVEADSMLIARDQGLIAPYYTPNAAQVPAEYKVAASQGLIWGASPIIEPIGFGYNSKLIPAGMAPTSIQDLLKPAWKGKMAIPTSTTGVRWVGGVYHVLGQQAGDAFLKKLAQQAVKPEAMSGAALMGMIAKGTMPASPAVFRDHALVYASQGAPVVWTPIQPVIADIDMITNVAHAPHPAAAALFRDFLLGAGGQKVFTQYHYLLTEKPIPFTEWVPESGMASAKAYEQASAMWQKAFNQTFGVANK